MLPPIPSPRSLSSPNMKSNNSDSKKDIRQRIRNASSSAASNAANKNINTSYGRSNSNHTLSSHSRRRRSREVFIPRPRTPLNNEDSLTSSHSEEDVMQSVQDEIKLLRCEIGTLKDHVKQMLHNNASHKEEPPSSSSLSPITAMMMMPPSTIRKSNTSKDRKKEEPPSSSSPSSSSIPRMMPPDPPSDRHRDHGRGTQNRSATSPPDRYDRATNVRPRRFDFARPHEASNARAVSATVVDPTVASVVDPPDEDDERRTARCRIYRRIARTIVILISAVAFLELGAILKQQCCALGTTLGTTLRTTLGKVSTFTTRSRQQHYYRVSQQTMDALHHFKSSPQKEIREISNSSFVVTEGEVDLVCEKRNHHRKVDTLDNEETPLPNENESYVISQIERERNQLMEEVEQLRIGLVTTKRESVAAEENGPLGLRSDVVRAAKSVLEKTHEENNHPTSESEDARTHSSERNAVIFAERRDGIIDCEVRVEARDDVAIQLILPTDIEGTNETIVDNAIGQDGIAKDNKDSDEPNDVEHSKYDDDISSETLGASSSESSSREGIIDAINDDSGHDNRTSSNDDTSSNDAAVASHQSGKYDTTSQLLISSSIRGANDILDDGSDRNDPIISKCDLPFETIITANQCGRNENHESMQLLMTPSTEGTATDTFDGSDQNDHNISKHDTKSSMMAITSDQSENNGNALRRIVSSRTEGTSDTINDGSDGIISKRDKIPSEASVAWAQSNNTDNPPQLIMSSSSIEGTNNDTADDGGDDDDRKISTYDVISPKEMVGPSSDQCANKNTRKIRFKS